MYLGCKGSKAITSIAAVKFWRKIASIPMSRGGR
jgi:hypothetical protein